jgi:hypothetical protein
MGALAWYGARLSGALVFHSTLGTALRLLPLIALCGLVYFGLLRLLRVREAREIQDALVRRLR